MPSLAPASAVTGMSVRVETMRQGTIRVDRKGDTVRITVEGREPLILSLAEAWQLSEAIDALASQR